MRVRQTAAEFLETLVEPVILVDGDVRFVAANTAAQRFVGKDPAMIYDRLGGEVLECVYADLPEGCGSTIHCEACEIRNSVTATLTTGENVQRAPAYQDLKTPEGVRRVRLLVSTEKVGDAVLLRIDDVEEG
jgi:PAS domain-containing protein